MRGAHSFFVFLKHFYSKHIASPPPIALQADVGIALLSGFGSANASANPTTTATPTANPTANPTTATTPAPALTSGPGAAAGGPGSVQDGAALSAAGAVKTKDPRVAKEEAAAKVRGHGGGMVGGGCYVFSFKANDFSFLLIFLSISNSLSLSLSRSHHLAHCR